MSVPKIPADQREQLAEKAWLLHVGGGSYRAIAEHISAGLGVRISHTTAGELVREGRAAEPTATRTEATADIRGETRVWLHRLNEDYRIGALGTAEAVPLVVRLLDRLARLHGTDTPVRIAIEDDRLPPTIDPEMAARLVDVEARSAAALEAARATPTK